MPEWIDPRVLDRSSVSLVGQQAFDSLCRYLILQLWEKCQIGDIPELIPRLFSPWATSIRQYNSPPESAPALSMYYYCFRFILSREYCPFLRRCFLASLIVPVLGLTSRYMIWFTLWSVIDSTVTKCKNWGQPGNEPGTSRTLSENNTPRPLSRWFDLG